MVSSSLMSGQVDDKSILCIGIIVLGSKPAKWLNDLTFTIDGSAFHLVSFIEWLPPQYYHLCLYWIQL